MDNQDIFKKEYKFSGTFFKGVVGLFLVSLIFLVVVIAVNQIKGSRYIGKYPEGQNTITVEGTGKIYAKPDLAVTSFSVQIEQKTVAGAMDENAKKMNAIIEAIKKTGINEKDIKTTNFYVYPRYEWRGSGVVCLAFPCPSPDQTRVLVGYEVTQTLEVKIRDMAKIGDTIKIATDLGANQINDVSFTIDNVDELKNQARAEAIKQAREKAKDLASQLNVRLIGVVGFQDGGGIGIPRMAEGYAMGIGGGEDKSETPQIETGERVIESNVSIIYEIN
ncbi:MAG: hypothetical protein US98_C0053G0011 [Parcubacteria group bacterium GW2011_GWC1_38_6]|nr:MAG: hypothetical protein US98_C0053G0011 [Parcubacteria group bacterium GW2011_GWC1_38_6]